MAEAKQEIRNGSKRLLRFFLGGLVGIFFGAAVGLGHVFVMRYDQKIAANDWKRDVRPVAGQSSALRVLLQTYLPALREDSRHREAYDLALARIPSQAEVLRHALAPASDLHIDVILQIHSLGTTFSDPRGSLSNALAEQVRNSQQRVLKILRENLYEVVGIEGVEFEKYDREEMRKVASQESGVSDPSKLDAVIESVNGIGLDASRVYCLRDDAHCVGIEAGHSWMLHILLFAERITTLSPLVARAEAAASFLRSEIAVAKVVRAMRAKKLRHGAIVMGAAHHAELVEILSRIGCKTTVYGTQKLRL